MVDKATPQQPLATGQDSDQQVGDEAVIQNPDFIRSPDRGQTSDAAVDDKKMIQTQVTL